MLQEAGTITADAVVKDTTTQAFVKDVIEESKRQPVLVDFWAPWCGPCKQLTPVLEKAVKATKGKVKLVEMNIDEHPAIPGDLCAASGRGQFEPAGACRPGALLRRDRRARPGAANACHGAGRQTERRRGRGGARRARTRRAGQDARPRC